MPKPLYLVLSLIAAAVPFLLFGSRGFAPTRMPAPHFFFVPFQGAAPSSGYRPGAPPARPQPGKTSKTLGKTFSHRTEASK